MSTETPKSDDGHYGLNAETGVYERKSLEPSEPKPEPDPPEET